jgi:peptide/nickel transport system permease protein
MTEQTEQTEETEQTETEPVEPVEQPEVVFAADVGEVLPESAAEAELAAAEGLVAEAEPTPLSQRELFVRRFKRHRLAIASLVVLFVLFVLCYGVGWFMPFEKGEQDLEAGAEFQSPSWDHLFGTDELGRDYLTEVLYAGQISLRIGLTVALLSTALGTVTGAIAGFYGRWADQILMRLTDLFLIVPLLAVLALARERFGSSPSTISYVLAGLLWMSIARVVRGQTLALKEKEFVEAARAVGASGPRIVVRHVLPNCIGPIVVNATLSIAVAIILESTLSFLGFGVDSSWGNLLEEARGNYDNHTHLLYFPGLAILLTVLCVNALGDGLRDALDPHAKH